LTLPRHISTRRYDANRVLLTTVKDNVSGIMSFITYTSINTISVRDVSNVTTSTPVHETNDAAQYSM